MKPLEWDELYDVLKIRFMMYDEEFPVRDMYFNGTQSATRFIPKENVESCVSNIKNRTMPFSKHMDSFPPFESYGDSTVLLLDAITKYPIEGKSVLNIGNDGSCWFESIILAYGGIPTTVDYNRLQSDHPLLDFMTNDELEESDMKFDVAFSISSYEHSGLGRYGDPVDPDADLKAMQQLKRNVKKDGLLFLVTNIGKDCIVWNAHRIYGRKRLPYLFYNWEKIDAFGDKTEYYDILSKDGNPPGTQPVFVLRNT